MKKSIALSLLAVTAGALASCGEGGEKTVQFWSSFGNTYQTALQSVVAHVSEKTGIDIQHESQGSYPGIYKNMNAMIGPQAYPDIAMGYPDHFAHYIGSEILVPMEDRLTKELEEDFYEEYMEENWFVDSNGDKHLYGIPFNKSTEVLGYNGTFVQYCADYCENNGHSGDANWNLGVIPQTWQDWEKRGDNYMTVYKTLVGNVLYGKRDNTGAAIPGSFKIYSSSEAPLNSTGDLINDGEGREYLIDMREVKESEIRLISWDSTDNAFITLVRQWGAKYTELKEEQFEYEMDERVGDIMFASAAEKNKVIDCLSFFKKLQQKQIFNTPKAGSFSSDAFATGSVMFMVCSSGGLSYNTKTPSYRFKIAPIPYYDDGVNARKIVISQGANICMTDAHANRADSNWEVIKNLTTGEYQTEWCLKTGYYPCSKSAAESQEYQDFLTEAEPAKIQEFADAHGMTYEEREKEVYATQAKVAYREGSQVNSNVYMNKDTGWTKFVDDAFIGSAEIREVVKNALMYTFNSTAIEANPDDRDAYYTDVIKKLVEDNSIKFSKNINVVK